MEEAPPIEPDIEDIPEVAILIVPDIDGVEELPVVDIEVPPVTIGLPDKLDPPGVDAVKPPSYRELREPEGETAVPGSEAALAEEPGPTVLVLPPIVADVAVMVCPDVVPVA
jgi:hypothetical protein